VAQTIRDIGALAGLAAFFGLAVLSLLYFSQARDVRRLREWAGRAPERDAEDVEATSGLAAERAEELRKVEEERQQREEVATAERQAAEQREVRRQRREAGLPELTRRERLRQWFGGVGGRGLPEPRYIAVAVGAVIVIGAAVAVGATQLLGGDNGSASNGAGIKPSQVEVAVLNGTNPPVNGLAGTVSDALESKGFRTGRVGNSDSSFETSMVEYTRGHKPEASKVAKLLKIGRVKLMSADIKGASAGATVAVVVGQDKSDFRA
jgi:LytR cell envelope-related transcriptional attenuator